MSVWRPVREYISANPELIAALGLIGTIGGIVIAVLLYEIAKPRRLLAYATRTFRIIPRPVVKLDRLEVSYNGYPVQALSVTRLTVWNAGNEALRRADIPVAHPPVIYVSEGVTLFEADTVEHSSAANNVSLEPVHEPIVGYALRFDYLDPGDGVVFNIVHDGTTVTDARLTGNIIGARVRRTLAQGESPEVRDGVPQTRKPNSGRAQLRFVMRVCLALLPTLGILSILLGRWDTGVFAISFGLLLGGGMWLLGRRAYPPANLKAFDDNVGTN